MIGKIIIALKMVKTEFRFGGDLSSLIGD